MILYTLEHCPRCSIIKQRLDAAGINYTICDDEKEMEALGIDELPQASIDGTLFGFADLIEMCKEASKQ